MKKIAFLFVMFAVLGLAACTSTTENTTGEAVVDSTAVVVDTADVAVVDTAAVDTPAAL